MGTLANSSTVLNKTGTKELYEKNMEALRKNHEELADMIETLTIEEGKIKILDSESGHPRVLYKKDDGEEVYIHNAEDPTQCANLASELLGQMEHEGIAVLFGFGLGYIAEELFNRFEKGHVLMVYEATPDLFKTALQTRDLTGLLNSDKVKILLGEGEQDLSMIHSLHNLIANGKFWVLKHHPSARLNEEAYQTFYKKLNDEKRVSDSSVATAVGLGRDFINTYMENIPSILKRAGVSKLKDVFKDRPAIIVAAGPSLEKNFHLLRKAKGKAVIIAVDVVLPTLLPAGILPDIVVAIDPLPDNTGMFTDNPILKDVPFICFAQFTPEIVKMYPGPLFINSDPRSVIHGLLGNMWDDKGYVECFGGSVAHFAFAVAEYVGSHAIAMIGLDLSFTSEKKYHAGDTTRLLQEAVEDPDYDAFKNNFEVKDIFGETKYSLQILLVFKTCFEKRIKAYSGKVINATEGGLPIEGAVPMRLADFIDEYCDLSEIDIFDILSKLSVDVGEYTLKGVVNIVAALRDKFNKTKKNSNRVLKYIKRIRTLKENGQKDTPETHNILIKVESIIEEIKHPILNVLSAYNYSLELYMKKQDVHDVDEIEDEWEKLDKQLDRGSHYYAEVVKTIDRLNKQFNKLIKAIQVEERADIALAEGSDSKNYASAAAIYENAGITAQAVRNLELARKSGNAEHNTAQEISLAQMKIKQFRFYEAREILENIKNVEPVGTDQSKIGHKVEEMLKECYKKIREWNDRTKKSSEMLEKAEANYGSHLESGYFYFRVKNYEKALKKYMNAASGFVSSSSVQEEGKGLIEAYYGLAHTYLALDDPENAIEIFEKALVVDPDNSLVYRDLGFIAYQNNNIESAELFFVKAIELAPADAEIYKPLADFYVSMNEEEKAIALYEKVLLANPDNQVIQQNLALLIKKTITETEISK